MRRLERKDVEELVTSAGLMLVRLTRSKHWKARVRRPDGSEATVAFPNTPSDHRALLNKRAQLRSIALG